MSKTMDHPQPSISLSKKRVETPAEIAESLAALSARYDCLLTDFAATNAKLRRQADHIAAFLETHRTKGLSHDGRSTR